MKKVLRTPRWLYLLGLFWSTNASMAHKLKSLLWLVYYRQWIKALYDRFQSERLDYVLKLHPCLPFMFRMKAYILKKVSSDFILQRLVGHYQNLHRYFGQQGVAAIHADGLILGESEIVGHKIQIVLQYIDCMSQEGQASVKLLLDKDIFYYAHIHFYDDALWVGGFQGCPNQMEAYRRFTKISMGMRPHNFMYLILTLIAKRLNLSGIYAVSGAHHYYQKKQRTMQQVQFGYDAFWSELGGRLMQDSIWFFMPTVYPRKNIIDIPSKKRSQYNQRYAIIDQVSADILGERDISAHAVKVV